MKTIIFLLFLVSLSYSQLSCDGMEGFEQICYNKQDQFADLINVDSIDPTTSCQVVVKTNNKTCKNYCETQQLVCVAAQDNKGNTCDLDSRHSRQTTEENGCLQQWSNQVCICDFPQDQGTKNTQESQDQNEQELDNILDKIDTQVNQDQVIEQLNDQNQNEQELDDLLDNIDTQVKQEQVLDELQDQVDAEQQIDDVLDELDDQIENEQQLDQILDDISEEVSNQEDFEDVMDELSSQASCLEDSENDDENVEYVADNCALIYTECFYEGDSQPLCGQNPSIDVVKSIQVPPHKKVTIYSEACFEGKTAVFHQSVECITDIDFRDLIQLKKHKIELLDHNPKEVQSFAQIESYTDKITVNHKKNLR